MENFVLRSVATVASPLIDIVYIHGLGGHPETSWAYEGKEKAFWPAKLAESFPNANVSLIGYPTTKLGSLAGGSDIGLLTAAGGVVELLASRQIGKRPLFFITHSLGGIIAKAALRQCADSTDTNKERIYSATLGLVLIGVPNSGAAMGAVCRHLPGLTSMQSAELARADTILLELAQWLRGKAGPDKIGVHCLYETRPLGGMIIVDAASANPGVSGCDPIPVVEDHVSMAKIPSNDHSSFTSIVSFIERACQKRAVAGFRATPGHASLLPGYLETIFSSREIQHSRVKVVDERTLFVDPVVYHQNTKRRITDFGSLLQIISACEAAIISGPDRSGKSLIARQLQVQLSDHGRPTLRIAGPDIQNVDIFSYIIKCSQQQYGATYDDYSLICLIIDDFDECPLNDSLKEQIVHLLIPRFKSIVITAFTQSPSVLFAPKDFPDPDLFEISPFGDEKLLELVQRWKALGVTGPQPTDAQALPTFELVRKLFEQTEVDKYVGSAVHFLQLIDTSSGSDISYSSYAACFETLVASHIGKVRPNWQNLDEAKNFISYLAFAAYKESASAAISRSLFERCLAHYKENFFSSVKDLREIAVRGFLTEHDDSYRFTEEYEWYFLCARHAAKVLRGGSDYDHFLIDCTSNIFSKKYANMIVFMAYFNDDNMILSLLLDMLDGLFSKAPHWQLSDEQRTIMLGLTATDNLAITSNTDVTESRARILREKVSNIIEASESVVALYTLPFLNPEIGDAEPIKTLDAEDVNADSYLKSLNALMRIHSVLGQILASRSGTFDAKTMVDCITRMVKASGRYISLNHAIAAVLVFDRQKALEEVDRGFDSKKLSKEQKLDKVERIFAFWSVFLSQAGLARYLSHDHAVRALKLLVGQYESEGGPNGKKNIPYNFTSVLVIASLYKNGAIDKKLLEDVVNKYGDDSSLIPILRVAVHFYSYYMPLSIQEKQFLSSKLNMQLRRIEVQRRKAVSAGLPSSLPATSKAKSASSAKAKSSTKGTSGKR